MTIQEQIDDLTRRMNNGEFGYGHTADEAAATQARISVLRGMLLGIPAPGSIAPLPAAYATPVRAESQTDWTVPLLIGAGVVAVLLVLEWSRRA